MHAKNKQNKKSLLFILILKSGGGFNSRQPTKFKSIDVKRSENNV